MLKTYVIGLLVVVGGFALSQVVTIESPARRVSRVAPEREQAPAQAPVLAGAPAVAPSGDLSPRTLAQIQTMIDGALAKAREGVAAEPKPAEPTEEERAAAERAVSKGEEIFAAALERGVWDDATAADLREQAVNMPGEKRAELHRRIANAINHEALTINTMSVF